MITYLVTYAVEIQTEDERSAGVRPRSYFWNKDYESAHPITSVKELDVVDNWLREEHGEHVYLKGIVSIKSYPL